MEETVLRNNYKPGRTVEEIETERLRDGLNRTGEENINVLLGLLSLNKRLKTAILLASPSLNNKPTFTNKKHDGIFELWNTLNKNGVRYIVIGNFASYFNGLEHFTPSVEIFVDVGLENKTRLGKALEELNISTLKEILSYQFNKGWIMLNLPNGYPLDIVTIVEGLEDIGFTESRKLASIAKIEGIEVPFLHLNHLISSKKAANHPKDQIDVIALEEIKREREARGEL